MTDQEHLDKAVEAAHYALLGYVESSDLVCGSETDPSGFDEFGAARDSVKAAAPHIEAKARAEERERP